MTIRGLYEWASERGYEDIEIVLSSDNGWLDTASLECGPYGKFIELRGRSSKYKIEE